MDINKQIDVLLTKYKDLIYIKNKNIIEGKIYVSENDFYEVSIDLSSYPLRFPAVEEVGERIPKKADRHIYTDSGTCCFTTVAKSQILLKTRIKTLEAFIKLIVLPYFNNNSFFELNQKYFTDEYSHGTKGILEGYADVLEIKNNFKIVTILYDRLINNEAMYKSKCYCGGIKPLRNCSTGKHFKNYNNFKLIKRATISSDLTNILEYLKN